MWSSPGRLWPWYRRLDSRALHTDIQMIQYRSGRNGCPWTTWAVRQNHPVNIWSNDMVNSSEFVCFMFLTFNFWVTSNCNEAVAAELAKKWHFVVVGQVVVDIAKDHSAFIFKVKQSLYLTLKMEAYNPLLAQWQWHILVHLDLTVVTQTWQASLPPAANPAHRTRSSMWAVLKVLNASLQSVWVTTGTCSCSSFELDGPSVTGHNTRMTNEASN